jgi:hypothetical protein
VSVLRRWSRAFHAWLDYNVVADDPNPQRTGLDCIGCTYPTTAEVRAAIVKGTSSLRAGTTLLKPQDVDRATREVMAVIRQQHTPATMGELMLGGRDRYAQCDDTCTVDCGACKGNGRPCGEVGDVAAMRQAVTR